jgi:hypothetical protein
VSAEPYRWRDDDDLDRDTMAVVTCAIAGDFEAAEAVLSTLDREQLVSPVLVPRLLVRHRRQERRTGPDGRASPVRSCPRTWRLPGGERYPEPG